MGQAAVCGDAVSFGSFACGLDACSTGTASAGKASRGEQLPRLLGRRCRSEACEEGADKFAGDSGAKLPQRQRVRRHLVASPGEQEAEEWQENEKGAVAAAEREDFEEVARWRAAAAARRAEGLSENTGASCQINGDEEVADESPLSKEVFLALRGTVQGLQSVPEEASSLGGASSPLAQADVSRAEAVSVLAAALLAKEDQNANQGSAYALDLKDTDRTPPEPEPETVSPDSSQDSTSSECGFEDIEPLPMPPAISVTSQQNCSIAAGGGCCGARRLALAAAGGSGTEPLPALPAWGCHPKDFQDRERVKAFLAQHGFRGPRAGRRRLFRTSFPLHTAAQSNDPTMVTLLIRWGADVKQVDSAGRTPLELAVQRGRRGTHVEVIDVLSAAMLQC